MRRLARLNGTNLWLWCPGCEDLHRVQVRGDDDTVPSGPVWEWNRALDEHLTVSPSILVKGIQWPEDSPFRRARHDVAVAQECVCHSFVKDGQWQFLGDSTHSLAGQTTPLVPLPEGTFE